MRDHMPLQRIIPAKSPLTNGTFELRRGVLLLMRAHIGRIGAAVHAPFPFHHHAADKRLFALMRALVVRQRVLRRKAALAFGAGEGFLVEVGGFVLLEFGFFAEFLVADVAGAVAVIGVRIGVTVEFTFVFGGLCIGAARPVTFKLVRFQVVNVVEADVVLKVVSVWEDQAALLGVVVWTCLPLAYLWSFDVGILLITLWNLYVFDRRGWLLSWCVVDGEWMRRAYVALQAGIGKELFASEWLLIVVITGKDVILTKV